MPSPAHFLEIACFNKESALLAAQAGAHRLELCANKNVGGISPDLTWVAEVKKQVNIPVFVMVRPRAGDFVYTDDEIFTMENYIYDALKIQVDGFVFGCLQNNFGLNLTHNAKLIQAAKDKPCTLHKALDETKNPFESLEDAIRLGFKNILSSGCAPSSVEGLPLISKLFIKCSNRINLMPGGNIRSTNLAHIKKTSGASWYHSAAIIGNSILPDETEIKALLQA